MDDAKISARDEGKTYAFEEFPAYCTGPDGQDGVFNSEAEVPAGWKMPNGKVKGGKAKSTEAASPAPVTTTEAPAVVQNAEALSGSPELDAAGWPWTEELHAATKTKTSAGLWRMRPGVARPEPKIAPLDL